MRKNLHNFSLVFGLFLFFMGTAQSQNGELILSNPDLNTWTCEVGEVSTFIWKYNFTEDGFDKQCDDIDPSSVNFDLRNIEGFEVVAGGGISVSGCFVSVSLRCLTENPDPDMEICVNALDPFQSNGNTPEDPSDDGIGCSDLMEFVMPVQMVFFNADMDKAKTVLTWQTASEVNSEGFQVQKSTDGVSFEELGFVNSRRSTGLKDYRFVDNNPVNGVNYYRLKQMDLNGDFAYSEIVSVKNQNKVSPISLYPNPIAVNEVVNVFVDSATEEKAIVSVFSISGAVISQTNHFLNEGLNKLNVETSELTEGLYIISVEMGSESFNKRLLVQ